MTIWRKRCFILFTFVGIIIFCLGMVIYTHIGLSLTSYVLKKTIPGLKIGHMEGTLYNFNASDLAFNTDGVEVTIAQSQFSLSGFCLLRGVVCINALNAEGIAVNIKTADISESEEKKSVQDKPFMLKTPVPIELESAYLKNVRVHVNTMRFGVDTFRGSATWIHDNIRVATTEANGVRAIFAGTPKKVKKAKEKDSLLQKRLMRLFDQPLIAALPNVHIPVKVNITELTGTGWLLHLGEDYRFDHVRISGMINNSEIHIGELSTEIKNPYQDVQAKLSGQITLAHMWPINAMLLAKTLVPEREMTNIVHLVKGDLLGTLHTETEVSGKNNFQLTANINFAKKYWPVDIILKGTHVQWPLIGSGEYQLNDFNFILHGISKQLRLSGKSDLKGNYLPPMGVKIDGHSKNERFNLNRLELDFADHGRVSLTGNIDWSDALRWQAEGQVNQLKLSKQWVSEPLDLDGKVILAGAINTNYQWQSHLQHIDIKGHLRKKSFSVSGKLTAQSGIKVMADHFKFDWGNDHLTLNGQMTEANPLIADFDLGNLGLFSGKITGKAKGHVVMSGRTSAPNLSTEIRLHNLAYNQFVVQELSIKADTHFLNQITGDVHVMASSLAYGDSVEIKKVRLDLTGSEQRHQLHMQLTGKPFEATLNLTGQLTNDRHHWHATVDRSRLSMDKKAWVLNHATQIKYDQLGQRLFVQAHCWKNPESRLCLTQDLNITDRGEINVELKNLDMSVLDLFLGDDTQILGNLSGKGHVQWKPGEAFPAARISLYSSKAYIHQLIGAKILTIPFDIFNVQLNTDADQARLDWQLSLNQYGKITGTLKTDDPKGEQRLSGNILLKNLSLSIFTPILQGNDYTKGLINANLSFGRTLRQPGVKGRLSVSQTDIQARQLPADIQAVSLTLNFFGQSSKLAGQIRTKEGVINLTGNANWENPDNWSADLAAKGAGVTISYAPVQSVTLVPDIHFSADQHSLRVNGIVQIPKARIKVESLSNNVVNVSPDEVMLDNNLQEVKPGYLAMQINSNLFIVIGDDVEIDAFGLNANIAGRLRLKQNKQGLGLNGQILIPKGRFHAYGQDLVIRKGELTFSGPAEMPFLNIEAIRNPEAIDNNVIAGIRVTGTPDNPDVKLFSEPMMSDQETLSYILRGQGLENSDQSESDTMTAILIGLGTAQSGKYIGNIGELFGIKGLTLDTQGSGDNSEVVVSGYILPNLQIKYGVGIFDSLASFTLRYRLMPRLYLDVVSSLAQSIDLLYQFETD